MPALLAAATIATQICYPLASGTARDVLIVVVVCLFAAASLTTAWVGRGVRAGAALVGAGLVGLAAEIVGVNTGFPFGSYAYTGHLGPRLLGAPVLIGLAWLMFAWPAAVVAARLAGPVPLRVAATAWALASWDLFLDPQLVAAGGWRWEHPRPHLPGVPTVPLSNLGGWLLVSLVVAALLQPVVRAPAPGDAVAITLFVWTWLSSVLALAAFLALPAAAAWGGAAMAAVAVPLLARLRIRSR
ncbi:MAG: carotenoid biosynthesis protein [Jatrophihabitans sp.]|nr:MAG: carotenoid biosynthesis protein [Jatrophihabitans sp.]